MILKQYYLGCLAHASYLLGDEASSTAIIVDPQRDIQEYLSDSEKFGLQIRHVFLSHFHADFIAGHLELRDRCGTAIPYAVLSGDTLFIGDVGRPDLRASLGWSARDLGVHLYDSLHNKLLKLPDETLLYPAHGSGSLCGKNLSSDTVSTIGVQRRMNYAVQPMGRQQFIDIVTADQPDTPSYFTYDAVLNARERPTLEDTLAREMTPLSLKQTLAMREEGAQVLDARDPVDFEGAHLRGAINIGLGGSYATWCGTVLDRERPLVLVTAVGSEEEAALRLGRIGLDIVAGHLHGGMAALAERPKLVARVERVTAAAPAEQLDDGEPPVILDVRTEREWQSSRIAGSVNIPLARLAERLDELPRERPIVVHCASGYRAAIAASMLQAADFSE